MVIEGFDLIQISQPRLRGRKTGGLSMLPGGKFAPRLTRLEPCPRAYGLRPVVNASAITARRAMKRDPYAEVSARIVDKLEAGAAPWIKPWSATPGANTPYNAVSNRPYSGCNVVLLWMAQAAGYRTPRFLTFRAGLGRLGGNVRKGEHGTKDFGSCKQLQVRGSRHGR